MASEIAHAPHLGSDPGETAFLRSPTVWLLTRVTSVMGLAARLGVAVLIVAASAVVGEFLFQTFAMTRLSMLFLGAVVLTAVTVGTLPALVAAVLAFAVYNFHLVEPRFTFSFAGADDALTLFVFLAVALLTGGLAGRVREDAIRNRSRADMMTTLFHASRTLSGTGEEPVLRARLAEILAGCVDGEAWVTSPAEGLGGMSGAEPDERLLRVAGLLTERRSPLGAETASSGAWRARRLRVDGEELGVAVWRVGETSPRELGQIDRLADIVVDLGASAVARARLSAQKAEADAVASTEKLRTALLSSISHDLRTPLAAILASASSLKDYDGQFSPETRRDLAGAIQEEAERLNRYVTNLLSMTRLESGALDLDLQVVSAADLAEAAAQRLDRRLGARRIRLTNGEGRPSVRVDPLLIEQALANLIENAVAYTPDGSEIEVGVRGEAGRVLLEVVDAGPGVPEAELGRIFEKFYRGDQARGAAKGAGMGLAIARGFVEAVGGTVEARPRPDGRPGLSVVISLPEAA